MIVAITQLQSPLLCLCEVTYINKLHRDESSVVCTQQRVEQQLFQPDDQVWHKGVHFSPYFMRCRWQKYTTQLQVPTPLLFAMRSVIISNAAIQCPFSSNKWYCMRVINMYWHWTGGSARMCLPLMWLELCGHL